MKSRVGRMTNLFLHRSGGAIKKKKKLEVCGTEKSGRIATNMPLPTSADIFRIPPKKIIKSKRDVRYEFAEQAGNLKRIEPALFRVLRQLATVDRDYLVRINAVESLGQIGGTRSSNVLRKCLTDENWNVRGYAAVNLAEVAGKHSRRIIERLLTDEANPWTKQMMRIATFRAGNRKILDAILNELASPDFHVRSATINGIGDFSFTQSERKKINIALASQLRNEVSSIIASKLRYLLKHVSPRP